MHSLKNKIYLFLLFGAVLISASSCNKSASSPSGGGTTNTTITYVNNTFEPVNITVNNVSQVVPVGSSVVYTGAANSTATGSAYSSGATTSGTQVGLKVTWNISNTFPASGNTNENLNIASTTFFLRVINNSSLPMTGLYVNYGLTAQTLDNISIPNDGKTYDIGYYYGYTNSNARAVSGTYYWSWPTLNLPFTINQTVTVTGN